MPESLRLLELVSHCEMGVDSDLDASEEGGRKRTGSTFGVDETGFVKLNLQRIPMGE
jgi:hypothetical protein